MKVKFTDYLDNCCLHASTAQRRSEWLTALRANIEGRPDRLVGLIREDLMRFEQTDPDLATMLREQLEQFGAIYGNRYAWAGQLKYRETEQARRVMEYVETQIRMHEDSGNESVAYIADAWDSAGQAFKEGRVLHLMNLATANGNHGIVNILRAWGR